MPKITLGDQVGDDITEALGDGCEAAKTAGDFEWDGHGAHLLYVFEQDTPLPYYGLTIPAGTYLRRVLGKQEHAWLVLGGDIGAWMDDYEARWQAFSEGPRHGGGPCGECGARANERCRVPGCQGEWT